MPIVKQIETETGTASLMLDGSVVLDNSGYKQTLTPEQHKESIDGKVIHFHKGTPLYAEMLLDYDEADIANLTLANFDGDYWDFGDESHTIPSLADFDMAPQ